MTKTVNIGTHPGQVTGVPPGQHPKTNPRVNTQASGSQVVDKPPAVTARKDDAAAADQAAKAKVAVSMSSACDGGLIQTTSG